jgi:hypothetical protein
VLETQRRGFDGLLLCLKRDMEFDLASHLAALCLEPILMLFDCPAQLDFHHVGIEFAFIGGLP